VSVIEVIVCDTSVVGHLLRSRRDQRREARWDGALLGRLDAAVLAISVVTVAESRAGFLMGRWGPRRTRAGDLDLESFLQIPVDDDALDEWARLRAAAKATGTAIGDNDLWIAATASTRRYALATCDRDHLRIARDLPVEVVYLQPPV
jgi:predicted nucleic acid-binding protein